MNFERFKSLMDSATAAALRGDVGGVEKVRDQMPADTEKSMVENLIETALMNRTK